MFKLKFSGSSVLTGLSAGLLLVSAPVGAAASENSEAVKFQMGDGDYYLHNAWSISPSDGNTLVKTVGDEPHSIVAKDDIIYIADNSDKGSYTVKRFNAFTGEQLQDLTIDVSVSTYKYSKFSNRRNFYLVKDDADNIIMAFDVVDDADDHVRLFWTLLDVANPQVKDLNVYHNTAIASLNWCCVGMPHFSGDVTSGTYSAYFPLSYDVNTDYLHDKIYNTRIYYTACINNVETSNLFVVWYEPMGYFDEAIETGDRSVVNFLNEEFYVMDNGLNPLSLRALSYPVSIATTEDWAGHDNSACGFGAFEFSGHRFVVYGMDSSSYMLCVWDSEIPDRYDRNSGFDLSGIEGKAVIPCSPGGSIQSRADGAAVRNFSAELEYPDTANGPVMMIYLYTPGQSLKACQLSHSDRLTGSALSVWDGASESYFSITDGKAVFGRTVGQVDVYALSGQKILGDRNTRELDLSRLAKGVYLMKFDGSAAKIKIK